MRNARLNFGIFIAILIHDDFDHLHTWYVIDSVAHQVTGPKRELESLVV